MLNAYKHSGIKKPATRTGSVKTYYGLLGKLGIKKPALGGLIHYNLLTTLWAFLTP